MTTTTKKPNTTATPIPDSVEFNVSNARDIRAAKIADYHKAVADAFIGTVAPGPSRVVLKDGTIVDRR